MTRLSDTQALILRTASHHPDGIAAPPAGLQPAPRSAVARALLKVGLLEVTDSAADQQPAPVWKLDGQAVFLRITAAGLQAIGVEVDTSDRAAQPAQEPSLAASDAEGVERPPARRPSPLRTRPRGRREPSESNGGLDCT